ncbi:UNVERIFIED_CONTAM: hypothetical protein Scaly_0519600 [Sesamum calycinum]|uniref:Uncharacterized protein n=1 Tax=Sesamum calycinum TaxID=2727403 RepID=A0AAW2RS63_9LAMI
MKRTMGDRKRTAITNKKPKTEWPAVEPKSNLRINRLKDDDLITIHNYLTSAESKAFVNAAESIGFVHQGSLGPAKGEAYRDNDRISVDNPGLAEAIWEADLTNSFLILRFEEKLQYTAGQRFGRHIDESIDLGDGRRTHYTLLIYLSGAPGKTKAKSKNDNSSQDSSEPLVGGETVFYGPRNALVAEAM